MNSSHSSAASHAGKKRHLAAPWQRHPAAMQKVIPLGTGIGSGADYAADVACARRFHWLADGASLAAAAIRYGLSQPHVHTLAIGFSSLGQLDEAIEAERAGPFDPATLDRVAQLQTELGL